MPLRTRALSAGLIPAEPKKTFKWKKRNFVLRRHVRCLAFRRGRCLSSPHTTPSIPFSVRWDFCTTTQSPSPPHLQTATGLPPATQKPAHAQLSKRAASPPPPREQAASPPPARMSTFLFLVLEERWSGRGFGSGERRCGRGLWMRGWSRGKQVWLDCLFVFSLELDSFGFLT